MSACAVALACAFAGGASAQSTGSVQAGLDRAVRLPLEIIWLQSEIQADLWRNPALARSLQGCAKAGAPKEGCEVSVRSAWHYTFDANSAVRPSPIVLSLSNGRQGSAILPPAGAVLLGGSTVHLVDPAYPSIRVELSAPQGEPLFLGNLAASDLAKLVALLVRQPVLASASAASVLQDGQIALRAPGTSEPVTVASMDLRGVSGKLDVPSGETDIRAEPALDYDFTLVAGALEKSAPLTEVPFSIALADLSAAAGRIEVPVHEPGRTAPKTQSIQLATAIPQATPTDIARLRAEVEAEIARERERIAHAAQARGAAKFRFGT